MFFFFLFFIKFPICKLIVAVRIISQSCFLNLYLSFQAGPPIFQKPEHEPNANYFLSGPSPVR